ncbi:LysR substrate-binding domain-containing protein [Curtanaerobium respiraculi]|uniref:LysR substrate-binding domain-containing protein n=1 Tax=Curtanaerobium respiraculi TaxID=2949669 RepID=UPI0024B32C0C|nr:LysR substrate-binding domain-containing protein [Curtanaerobium respiraculi]
MAKKFAVSGQHYLFSVQAFAHTVLAGGGIEYSYGFRNGTTRSVIEDVYSGRSNIGVLFQTTENAVELNKALDDAGLEFTPIISSKPYVALPNSHPLSNAKSLHIEDLADYPYVYFEQEKGDSFAFYEEALASVPRERLVATTDRASLTELICALNGYTITSGILVGITDGSLLLTIPLITDVTLKLGYVARKNEVLEGQSKVFVDSLTRNLNRYVQL